MAEEKTQMWKIVTTETTAVEATSKRSSSKS